MASALIGICLHGGLRPYGGTFLVFSDYMRPAVRTAAITKLPVTYVWIHDSIGLGEDGPPTAGRSARRAAGDARTRCGPPRRRHRNGDRILERVDRPAGLCLTRQDLPTLDRRRYGSAEGVAKGGYILAEAGSGRPQVLLMATGSEVPVALAGRQLLEADGIPTRVVSLPCWEAPARPRRRARGTAAAGSGRSGRSDIRGVQGRIAGYSTGRRLLTTEGSVLGTETTVCT